MMQAPIKQHIQQPIQTVSHTLPASSSVAPPTSKTVYDSLAPLNIPSKPIVYVEEQQASTVAPATVTDTNKTEIDPRMDEKAKLESILFSSMKPGAGDGSAGSSGVGSSAGSYNQRGAGFHGSIMPGVSGGVRPWTPRMPMSTAANRPLPANYVCIICKKPGHHKSLCPEAVRLFIFEFST